MPEKDKNSTFEPLTNDLYDYLNQINIDPLVHKTTIELLLKKGLSNSEIIAFLKQKI